MLVAHAKKLLGQIKPVINVATSNLEGCPNAATKLILKIKDNFIYLVDYSLGKTLNNLKVNPRVSLAFEDIETAKGYRINGEVEIIESGPEFERMVDDVRRIDTAIVVSRVLEGLQRNKRYEGHMMATSEKFVIYKIRMQEIVEFGPHGALRTEKLS